MVSTWSTVNGRERRTYQLTDSGRRALAGERAGWREFSTTVGRFLDPVGNLPGTPPAAPA